MNKKKGYYLGRFQPFCLHHLDKVREILNSYPDIDLTIGVAGWNGERSRQNFLEGNEAAEIVKLTLKEYLLEGKVGVVVIDLFPGRTIEETLKDFLNPNLLKGPPVVFFSGSEKTLSALRCLKESGLLFDICDLHDQEMGGSPRATQVRESLIRETGLWRIMVAPSAHEYLLQFRQRLLELPDGEKRPWANQPETFSQGKGLERG